VPFWVLAAFSFGIAESVPAGLAVSAAVAYGALTLAFLGGVRWGLAVGPHGARRQERELALGSLAPLAGFAAIFLPPAVGVSLLIAALLLQTLWDVASAESGRLPVWFSRLRGIIAAVAVLPMLAVLGRTILSAQP
jgi:hypothetical protein